MPRRINVGKVVTSRRFAAPYKVKRHKGRWSDGEVIWDDPVIIDINAAVTVASPEQLEILPEGDRLSGAMLFYSTQELYVTREDTADALISDTIEWNGKEYKILQVSDWSHHGYWMAFAVLMQGR